MDSVRIFVTIRICSHWISSKYPFSRNIFCEDIFGQYTLGPKYLVRMSSVGISSIRISAGSRSPDKKGRTTLVSFASTKISFVRISSSKRASARISSNSIF
jgi:hypothetical protein